MQELPVLNMERREITGGRRANRLRRSGFIPAIIYGKDMDNIPVKIKASDLRAAVTNYGKNTVFTANVAGGGSFPIIIKEMDHDFLTGEIIHADLQKISLNEAIRVEVPIRIHGRELLENMKLVVSLQKDNIMVKCLPQDTPQSINVDVSGMKPGESITAAQLELPEGVTLEDNPEEVIVHIMEAKAADEEPQETAAAEGEAAAN